jgi:hypothetical protein
MSLVRTLGAGGDDEVSGRRGSGRGAGEISRGIAGGGGMDELGECLSRRGDQRQSRVWGLFQKPLS